MSNKRLYFIERCPQQISKNSSHEYVWNPFILQCKYDEIWCGGVIFKCGNIANIHFIATKKKHLYKINVNDSFQIVLKISFTAALGAAENNNNNNNHLFAQQNHIPITPYLAARTYTMHFPSVNVIY
jgi:hypothetical protein